MLTRGEKLHRFLGREANTETPLDEQVYAKRIVPPAEVERMPVGESDTQRLADILTRLKTLEEGATFSVTVEH